MWSKIIIVMPVFCRFPHALNSSHYNKKIKSGNHVNKRSVVQLFITGVFARVSSFFFTVNGLYTVYNIQ